MDFKFYASLTGMCGVELSSIAADSIEELRALIAKEYIPILEDGDKITITEAR